MLLFSYGTTAQDVDVSDSSDYCCITTSGTCLGPYAEYGNTLEDLGWNITDLQQRCIDGDGEFRTDACPAISQCTRGCCVFRTGSNWYAEHNVEQESCSALYEQSFFDPSLITAESCSALLMTDYLEKYFNVINSDDVQLTLNTEQSFLQKVGDPTVCSFTGVSSSNYNYGVDCDGSGRLSFGTYYINAIAQHDGKTYSYKGNVYIYNEEIEELVLTSESTDTLKITGQIFQYERVDDDFVETETPVRGATITLSGVNVQNTSGSDGRFILTNVPFDTSSPMDRVLSISAPGFNVYGQPLVQLDGDEFLGKIYLVPGVVGDTMICCPLEIGGCKEGGSSVCFAGMGRTGEKCFGTSPSDACNLPASFCCVDPMLCPNDKVSSGCGSGQGCSVPCLPEVQCTPDAEIRNTCFCENPRNFVNSGYCCQIGENKYLHSDTACGTIGQTVTGIVLGKGRSDSEYKPQSGATVMFGKETDSIALTTKTQSDGKFSITLTEGNYDVNAFKTGFVPDNSRKIRITKVGDSFEHNLLQSPFDIFNNKDDVNSVLEKINTTFNPIPIPGFLNGEDFDHVIVLDYSVPGCDWSESNREDTLSLNYAKVNHVKGRKELEIEWGIDDCLELSHFRIERKATKNIDGEDINDESDSNWVDIAMVPGSRTSYVDSNVRWSELTRTYTGLPILEYDEFDEQFNLGVETAEELVVWEYEYRITPYFSNQGEGRPSSVLKATMGNSVCEGKEDIFTDEFCGYNDLARNDDTIAIDKILIDSDFHNPAAELQGLRTLRIRCDSNNTIKWTENTQGNVNSRVCTKSSLEPQLDDGIYLAPSCFGPDGSGSTKCAVRSPCGQLNLQTSGPFGMFHTLNLNNNFCYGDEIGTSGRYEHACVLQPFRTTSDKCMYCEEVFDCADYTSEQACGIDNCMVGNYNSATGKSCEWINTSMKSVGEGACIPAAIRPSESFCHLADRNNLPFSINVGWSDDFCSELGNCYSTVMQGCKDCTLIANNCENYRSEEECLGSYPSSRPINIAYPKPEDMPELTLDEWLNLGLTCVIPEEEEDPFYNYSNDGCGVGVCSWDYEIESCFRDANSNKKNDNNEDNNVNYADIDNYPPTMTLVNRNNIFSENEDRRDLHLRPNEDLYRNNFEVNFAENRFGFRYCIDREDNCCPHLPGNKESLDMIFKNDGIHIDVPSNEVVDKHGDGVYYLRYLAQDSGLNIAPLESLMIIVDTTPPKFEALVGEWALSGQPGYAQLIFDVISKGTDVSSGTTEAMSCEFNLNRLGRPSESEIELNSISPSSNGFFIGYNMDYTVPDGLYDFNIRCWDAAGNVNDTYWENPYMRIRADGQDNLNIINPADGGAIPSFDNVDFIVQTEVSSSCWISWPDKLSGEREYLELSSGDGLEHKENIFQLFDVSHNVFDTRYENGYKVGCRELEDACSVAPRNVCTSNEDCSNGVCEQRIIEQDITFVVDELPPETLFDVKGYDSDGLRDFKDISNRRKSDERKQIKSDDSYDGVYYFNDNVSVELDCQDTIIDTLFPTLNAGCDVSDVMYCTKPLGSVDDDRLCDPNSEGQVYSGEIIKEDSFVVCFYSTDKVGNEEDVRCRHFYIEKIPPELEFSAITAISRNNSYFVDDENAVIEGSVLDSYIENFHISMTEPDKRESVVLDLSGGMPTEFSTSVIPGNQGYSFMGPLKKLTSVNARGPNRLRLFAEDWFGNTNSKIIHLYYDIFPPFLGSYSINLVTDAKTAIYDEPITVSLFIDDVFWTNQVENVRVQVSSITTSDFATPYQSEEILIDEFEIVSNAEITAKNASDEVVDLIKKMLAPDKRVNLQEVIQLMSPYAQWKEFVFTLDPTENPMTLLNDIGVGEYLIEIYADDSFGQTMYENILFNVADPNPPEITLESPQVVFAEDEDDEDVRTVITNNINEIFRVRTNVSAQCYFDLGDRPHRTNAMSTDLSSERREHTYVLSGFTPFEGISPIPFVISCEKHGGDLVDESYTLLFDRRPMVLDVSLDRGNIVSEERGLQTHILEYSLDYSKRFAPQQQLQPNIVVEERSGKAISCSFTCSSSNSVCPEEQGKFNNGWFAKSHSKQFNFLEPGVTVSMPYAFGDYMFEIFCDDQAGNVARAKELVVSIRDPRAPQKLSIIENGDAINPRNDKQIFLTDSQDRSNVTFTVATNMLSKCSIDFINKPLATIDMSAEGSLTHRMDIELVQGTYRYRYVCESATDENQESLNSDSYSFSVVRRDSISGLTIEQVREKRTDLPVVRFSDVPSQYLSVEYAFDDKNLSNPKSSYNTESLILLGAKPGSTLYVRFIDDEGLESEIMSFNLSNETLTNYEMGDVGLVGDGSFGGAYADYEQGQDGIKTYYARNQLIFPQISTNSSDSSIQSIQGFSNGGVITDLRDEYIITNNALVLGYNLEKGMSDLLVWLQREDETNVFVRFNVNINYQPPTITSVSPRFIDDADNQELEIRLSEPAYCDIVYSHRENVRQVVEHSRDSRSHHIFKLENIKIPFRRYDASQVSIICRNRKDTTTEYQHLMQVDAISPKIRDVISDNSIRVKRSNTNYEFTVVRDEDLHIILHVDEYARCLYRDEDGNEFKFSDYYLHNLYPHTSLPVKNGTTLYTVLCEDEVNRRNLEDISISVTKDTTRELYLHNQYPVGITNEKLPELEVFTFRDAECTIDVIDRTETPNIFFQVFDTVGSFFTPSKVMEKVSVGHRYRHFVKVSSIPSYQYGLEPGRVYTAAVRCEGHGRYLGKIDGAETEFSFRYTSSGDPRPIISIN